MVANESYEEFAKALQNEIEEDCGVDFTGRIKDKGKKQKVNLRKGFEADPMFLQIWDKIKFHTKYSVNYETAELITLAAKAVKDMDETKSHPSAAQRKKVVITDEGIEGQLLSDSGKDDYNYHIDICPICWVTFNPRPN